MNMSAIISSALLSLMALAGCQQSEAPDPAQPAPSEDPYAAPASPQDNMSGQMDEPAQTPPEQEPPAEQPPKTPSG